MQTSFAPLSDSAPNHFGIVPDQAARHYIPLHLLIARLITTFAEINQTNDVSTDPVLRKLIARLIQSPASTVALELPLPVMNRLTRVAHYIDEHLSRSLLVKELASEACMSEPHFYRTFRQWSGLTPLDYINQQRIALASILLGTTNQSLADISFACGFNNVTYFMKMFRRTIGLSPTQYRKRTVSQ